MTKLIGILNLTPDSFSDGGAVTDIGGAIERLIADGAHIIDVGAESTRPGATPLRPKEERARLAPFFALLPKFRRHMQFSLDTRHAETAAQALEHGVQWLNDVSGLADPTMRATARESDCTLVLMHSLSIPADPALTLPEPADPVAEVLAWARGRIAELEAAGIAHERLVFDPGLGFGKTQAQSLALLRRVEELRALGLPLLIGHSRKSFLRAFTDVPAPERDDATLAVSAQLITQGAEYLRVHNVARHAELLR